MGIKENIVEIFAERKGEIVSGEYLAEKFNVSRNAVWKAVESLRKDGYKIESAKKGYCFDYSNDAITQLGISKYLATDMLGREIKILKEVDSTNNYAKLLAQQGAPEGLLIVAETQTGGRGRFDRNFFSPWGSGIYMTFILYPKVSPQTASMITSCAAVSVAEAVEKSGKIPAQIKWVNDVYAGGKKICGILTEAGINFESSAVQYAVVGIGINVFEDSFPSELSDKVTSISLCSDEKNFIRNKIIADVLNSFEFYYKNIEKRTFLKEYIRRSNVLGKNIEVIGINGTYRAQAIDIDENFALVVRREDGSIVTLNSGEVSIRPENHT